MTGNVSDWDGKDPDLRPESEMEQTPRRSRQPVIAVLALIAIVLLVLAVGVFGGIF